MSQTKKKKSLRTKIEEVLNDETIVPDEAFSFCCDILSHSDEPWLLAFMKLVSDDSEESKA